MTFLYWDTEEAEIFPNDPSLDVNFPACVVDLHFSSDGTPCCASVWTDAEFRCILQGGVDAKDIKATNVVLLMKVLAFKIITHTAISEG